jgi:hypothetical protein
MSKICQEAIIRAIRIEEMRSHVGKDIEKLAMVFREERKESNRKFFEEGFKDGIKDAFRMSYEEMSHIAYAQDDSPETVFEAGAGKDSSEKFKNGEFETETSLIIGYAEDDARDFYVQGWVAGFVDVWDRVRAKLSIHEFKKE